MKESIELKDLAGLAESACKLLDVLGKGCTWFFEPYQIKRIAKAKSIAADIELQTEFKKQIKDALVTDVINTTHSLREQRQCNNISEIYANAAKELSMIDDISDTPVDADWSARFFDYAKDISNEEAQIIWGKILSGEIQSPGEYSKRTLSVLRDIETEEAHLFVEACQYVVNLMLPNLALSLKSYDYWKLERLFDCGLFLQSDAETMCSKGNLEIQGKTLSLNFKSATSAILIDGYKMSKAGIQLYELVNAQTNLSYLTQLKDTFERRHGVKLEVAQISR